MDCNGCIQKTKKALHGINVTESEQQLEGEACLREQTQPTELPSVQENSPPCDMAPPPQYTDSTMHQQHSERSGSTEVEEIHDVYRNPPDHQNNVRVYNERVDHHPGIYGGSGFKHEQPQLFM